jgi:hypothetical protein
LLAALTAYEPIVEGHVAFVTPDRIWDVRTSFSLDSDERHGQLDRMYELVGDVLPPNTLPIATDWGGNIYFLLLADSSGGGVVYWDHEREANDHRVKAVASSVGEFFARLVPDPNREDDYDDY